MPKFAKRSRKAGLPPGTLVHIGEKRSEKARIRLVSYDELNFLEKEAETASECCAAKAAPGIAWVNVDGIHQMELLQQLGDCFGLHPLVLEDIMNTDQRPKMEDFGEYVYIVLKMLGFNHRGEIVAEQVSLILGQNFVLSFRERESDIFNPIVERIRNAKGFIRREGADYLAHALLDAVVDHYFVVLEKIEEEIERLEEEVVAIPTPKTLQKIHRLKRELIFLRKAVFPFRAVISALERGESPFFRAGFAHLPARHLRPHCAHHRHPRDLPRPRHQPARHLSFQRQQPHEFDHAGAHRDRHHLHAAHLPRRRLRHEFQIHARTRVALGIPGSAADDDDRGYLDAGVFPQEEVAIARKPALLPGTLIFMISIAPSGLASRAFMLEFNQPT